MKLFTVTLRVTLILNPKPDTNPAVPRFVRAVAELQTDTLLQAVELFRLLNSLFYRLFRLCSLYVRAKLLPHEHEHRPT